MNGTGRGRESDDPVRVLLACGWLTPTQASDPRLKIADSSSSHTVFRVTAPDGRTVVVKQRPRKAAESGRNLSREFYVYRMAKWMPALADLLPNPLFIDERQQVLVLETPPSERRAADEGSSLGLGPPGVASQLGRKMAAWHRATTEVALWPSLAVGVLSLPDALDTALEGRAANTRDFMRAIAADAELAAALREALSRHRHLCLIHGDIRRENWMVERRGGEDTLRVFDWEMSGSGDPAWDVGSVLAEALLHTIRTGGSMPSDTRVWPTASESAIREFVLAYVAEGGLIDEREGNAWDHVTGCASARLLHVCCEWAEAGAPTTHGAIPMIVAMARDLVRNRAEAAALLTVWSVP